MASGELWPVLTTSTGSSGGTYPWNGGGNYAVTASPWIVTSGGAGGGGWTAPAPRDPTALEWLDAEVEKVCKLARLAR